MKPTPRVTSSVIFVADVDRSVDLHCEVLSCEVSIHDGGAALLLAPGGYQLYLIGRGGRAWHPSGAIGPQYLIWAVDSALALQEILTIVEAGQTRTPPVATTSSPAATPTGFGFSLPAPRSSRERSSLLACAPDPT